MLRPRVIGLYTSFLQALFAAAPPDVRKVCDFPEAALPTLFAAVPPDVRKVCDFPEAALPTLFAAVPPDVRKVCDFPEAALPTPWGYAPNVAGIARRGISAPSESRRLSAHRAAQPQERVKL